MSYAPGPQEWDVVVIGSGPAGQKAAICAAEAGRRVLVVDRDSGAGGAGVRHGTIPSKTLRETALVLASFQRRSAHVLDVSCPESMQITSILSRLDEVEAAYERIIGDQFSRHDIERMHGRARFVAPLASPIELEIVTVHRDVRRVCAKIVVIATGSRPRAPANVPIDHEYVLDTDSILSIAYIPRSLTVIGGGVMACEYASIFAALGAQVTIVDAGERPLGFVDEEIALRFLEAFERTGGRFVGGACPIAIAFDGFSSVVTELDTGGRLEADKLLYARSRVAAIEGLHLDAVGLTADAAGVIPVDEYGCTSAPGIYAVGDAAAVSPVMSSAMDQGRRAICHALGAAGAVAADLAPVGIYTIPEIAQVGLTEAQARQRHGAIIVGRARFDELARGQIAAQNDGLLKIVADADGRRVLGVQIVGEGATELIHVGQMAMLGHLHVDVFVENTMNFPSFAEAYRFAALDVIGRRARGGEDGAATIASSRRRCA
jgi:NAD(P) transhydrogenase